MGIIMRDCSLDLGKGLAILFVYLGHSILYHPISMPDIYPWCMTVERFIISFNMPMFFLISGYLFSNTRKGTMELYRGKTMRLLVPYLTTMAILIGVKVFLPASLSYNSAVSGGWISIILNALCYGGDRWFVYVLYIIFLLLIPVRHYLMYKWIDFCLIMLLIGVFFLDFLPGLFVLDKVFYYMVFFISGFMLNNYYQTIKVWALKRWHFIYVVFLVCNLFCIDVFCQITFVFRFVLPFIGTIAMMILAFQMEKVREKNYVVKYIEYSGKYSLQFYLFTFCYPIIRWGIVSVLHVTNPVVIILSVFVLQLVTITIIVEVTRRVKWLKIPCGY